jgi:hypothetical protein
MKSSPFSGPHFVDLSFAQRDIFPCGCAGLPILDEAIRIHGRSSEILFGDLIAVFCSGETLM